jgi:putative integral membrane protein (TIGR02587 family)
MANKPGNKQKPDAARASGGLTEEFRDLMRGFGGAALVGVPLVYTMEVWDFASFVSTRGLLIALVCAFALNVGYDYLSGFRKGTSFWQSVAEAVESLAIGVCMASLLLFLIGVIGPGTPFAEGVGKVALEAIPLSFGASVAYGQFGSGQDDENRPHPDDPIRLDLIDAGIAFAGALLFCSSVAPTEEILLIASQMTDARLLVLMGVSLLLSYIILFVANFAGREERASSPGLLQTPLGETVLSYGIALLVAFTLIVGLHGLSPAESPYTTLVATVVLAFPAAVGGAAGRLLT